MVAPEDEIPMGDEFPDQSDWVQRNVDQNEDDSDLEMDIFEWWAAEVEEGEEREEEETDEHE